MNRQLEAAFNSGNRERIERELKREHCTVFSVVSGRALTNPSQISASFANYREQVEAACGNIEHRVDYMLTEVTFDALVTEVRRRQKIRLEGGYDD